MVGATQQGLREERRLRMKRSIVLLTVATLVLGVLAVGSGYAKNENAAKAKCSEATLDGTYLFAEDEVILTGNDQTPFALAGYEVYNGNGKVRGVQSGNFGGEIVRNEHFSGTYTVKADCTATVTYPNGEPFRYDLFAAPDGSKFTLVQVNPSEWVTSGFELRGTAKRVGD
jgi:hypothetical protein